MKVGRGGEGAGGVQGRGGGPPAHGLAVTEHPPAARAPGLRDQRQRLRGREGLVVAPRVVGVRVGDEGEAAHHQWVEPQTVPGQRDSMVPGDLCRHSSMSSPLAKSPGGTWMPSAAYASSGTPMSATTTRPASFDSPTFGRPRVIDKSALTLGE